ncbi:MAG TPA: 3-methyl-2-oxobutanoate hydroxymethyltransferase [Mycobacteriales bacterium]|nr:3-methyl-2-oxobutanoate hydroxymethyltransferase [Mycobacteriales bacterium]
MATTAAEARFRIDVPIAPSRATRVMALDPAAAAVVRSVAEQHWAGARFFTCHSPAAAAGGEAAGEVAGVVLRRINGSLARLSDELDGADVAVMVATADASASAAATIGDACTQRGIMTAAVILGDGYGTGGAGGAVSALRPHARVLMVTSDEHDVAEVLTALRA